tara:strand:+ start:365 stop:1510 length:1146 start_codon:yes stop_codon:yes gene_type:complete
MKKINKDPVFVVVQLSGGNDFMNTFVPYGNPLYYDFRKTVGIPEENLLQIDNNYGFNPALGRINDMYKSGNVAIVSGVGYPEPDRSHFRSMDIWHTAEPTTSSAEGWLGRVIRELDPDKKNVCTGVSFGQGLPRAMYLSGVPAISVRDLESYGLLTNMSGQEQRRSLNVFTRMYMPVEFDEASMIMSQIGQTGIDALAGVDMLKPIPTQYSSSIEYGDDQLSQSLRGIAQVHTANIGTRIFYAELGGFDTHGAQMDTQTGLLTILSRAVGDFFDDLKEHDAAEEVIMLIFTEFGRRIRDNGNGTDHGSGGGAILIGDRINGNLYGEYPSLDPADQLSGDMHFNNDFRSIYSTVLDDWLGIQPDPIVNGSFEKFEKMITPLK